MSWSPLGMMETSTNSVRPVAVNCSGWRARGKFSRHTSSGRTGKTRLFTAPGKTAENLNSDICVINCTGNLTGELIVLYKDGGVRATYREHEGSILNLSDVACDSMNRIIVSDLTSKSLHLLSPYGTFLKRLLSDMFEFPLTNCAI